MNEWTDQLESLFKRTRTNIQIFMSILSPAIQNAKDEHERLYFHHIYEEEEQRLERLNALIPKLSSFNNDASELIRLLQDLNLEKFGLHNFLEHLDLALYHFKDEENSQTLNSLLNESKPDYLLVQNILAKLNEDFDPSISTGARMESDLHKVETAAHNHDHDVHGFEEILQRGSVDPKTQMPMRKALSVGSLKSYR